MSWWWIFPRSKPCSPTSGRSSPRTRASSICARRPTANSIYTRRIGAAATMACAASSDIDAALKLTGTAGSLVYGGFVAQEDEYRNGRRSMFAATRVALPMEHSRFGYLGTWTDRPFLDRDALVNAVDYEVSPSDDSAHQRPNDPFRYRHERRRRTGAIWRGPAPRSAAARSTRTATNPGCRPISIAARR